MQPTIILSTLNAKYSHASFGLRYLLANLGPWRAQAVLREFTINQSPMEIVEALMADRPRVIGFGVYIWNVAQTTAVIRILRVLWPDATIVIGGPEVSYEYERTAIFELADHLITGEADLAFKELVDALEAGESPPKVISAILPDVGQLVSPYTEYSDEDLAKRLIYVEASRGCPFKCEFCLSSLDIPVRSFPLEDLLAEFKLLLDRGLRAFKFVDRTFNLNVAFSKAILEFCLDNYRPGLEFHFEMIPDRLPEALRELIARFPEGAVQFEVGIQTFTEDVSARISRRQKIDRIEDNFAFLLEHTGVHIHADLIFGLPGETLESFGASFDKLYALAPHEIQMGILKRLRGTPIIRHTDEFRMKYNPLPPYEILETSTVPFDTMTRMKRFARYFELYHNSGNFLENMRLLQSPGAIAEGAGDLSPFYRFLSFSDWLYAETKQTHTFALTRLYKLIFMYLTEVCGIPPVTVAHACLADYDRHDIRRARLEFLRPYVDSVAAPRGHAPQGEGHLKWGARRQTPVAQS